MPLGDLKGYRRATVLLVEDDPGDQELTRRALGDAGMPIDLKIVNHGAEALDYLHRHGDYSRPETSPTPDLILLDLNMPRMSGQQVLHRIKQTEELNHIPVVVLTTSNQEAEILRSYDLGCNSYIQKPVDMGSFMRLLRELGHYWFELVALPQRLDAQA